MQKKSNVDRNISCVCKLIFQRLKKIFFLQLSKYVQMFLNEAVTVSSAVKMVLKSLVFVKLYFYKFQWKEGCELKDLK